MLWPADQPARACQVLYAGAREPGLEIAAPGEKYEPFLFYRLWFEF
jgi:hypothetical protein